jgi:hypothetical protein
MLSAFAGAMIVVSGGLYALLLALSRLRRSRRLAGAAAGAYRALVLFVCLLADRLALTQAWNIVLAVMLAGYLVAPHAIWHLTRATHVRPMDES